MTLLLIRRLCLCPLAISLSKNIHPNSCASLHHALKCDGGILDDFTSHLTEKQQSKWASKKNFTKKKLINGATSVRSTLDFPIGNLEIHSINELFQKAIDYEDSSLIRNLTKQCLTHNKTPSLNIITQVLSICSQNGDKDTILQVLQLCEKIMPETLKENSYFEYYIAEAMWIKGDITNSLRIFKKVYRENVRLRRKVKYPNRTNFKRQVFLRLADRLQQMGQMLPILTAQRLRVTRNEKYIINVLAYVEADLYLSVRKISLDLGMSKTTVHQISKDFCTDSAVTWWKSIIFTRSILKNLILDSVANQSEATTVNLRTFSEMLVTEYNDYFMMGCLWHTCMLSDWFSDQQIAFDLLEKYATLGQKIVNKIPWVVRESLRQHNTDIVYRLIEALLRLKMDSEIGQILFLLIDYWIKRGDFRQCKEIIMWSLQNDIKVPLLVSNNKCMSYFAKYIDNTEVALSVKPTPKEFKF